MPFETDPSFEERLSDFMHKLEAADAERESMNGKHRIVAMYADSYGICASLDIDHAEGWVTIGVLSHDGPHGLTKVLQRFEA